MRVNKFYRPLPHILGSSEFQKHSHAGRGHGVVSHLAAIWCEDGVCLCVGIIPVPKPSTGSGMPSPREASYNRHRLSIGSQGNHSGMGGSTLRNPTETNERRLRAKRGSRSQDWSALKQSVTLEFAAAHHSFEDFGSVPKSDSQLPSEESAASEADAEAYVPMTHPDPLFPSLDGGLFDADEDMSHALANYRQMHGIAPKRKRGADEASSHRSHLTNPQSERSQASRDLENLGKAMNDLQLQLAAQKKERPSLRSDD